MTPCTRRTLWLLALMALSLLGACKKDKPRLKAATEAALKATPAPKEVVAYLGLRNPGKVMDDALALGSRFTPLPFTRASLLDLLSQQANVPRDVMTAVDVAGNVWLVALDEAAAGHPDPYVLTLPILSKKAMETALSQQMEVERTEGELTRYRPKTGQVGLQPLWLRVEEKHAFITSDPKVFAKASAFLRGTLVPKEPIHDATLHLLAKNFVDQHGKQIDQEIKGAMDEMHKSLARQQGSLDQKPMAQATEKTLDRYLKVAKSAREVILGLEVDRERVTLIASGKPQPGGELAKLIRQQRTGAPLAAGRLPASSWLVVSDHGNPESALQSQSTWKPALEDVFKEQDPAVRKQLLSALDDLTKAYTGDYTMALHRAPVGAGLTISVVSAVRDGENARKATDSLVEALTSLIRAEMARKGEKLPPGAKLAQTPFEYRGAKGAVVSVSVPPTPGKEEERRMVSELLGDPMVLAWAYQEEYALVSIGKGAEAQLKVMVDGPKTGQSLAQKPDFERIVASGNNRVGLVYLSLLDLARWFKGTPLEAKVAGLDKLSTADVESAPFLDWGVDEERDSLDVTLQLPAEHFLALKPLLDAFSRGGLGGAMAPPVPMPPMPEAE